MSRPGKLAFRLVNLAVTKETLRRYRSSLLDFLTWANRHQVQAWNIDQLDHALRDFVTHLFVSDPLHRGRQKALNLRAAILHYIPNARHHLGSVSRAITAWGKVKPSVQRPPMPFPLLLLTMDYFLRHSSYHLAALSLLAFRCYLRVSEALAVTPSDITFPTPVTPGSIFLKNTKTGRNQSVLFNDPVLVLFLRDLVADCQDDEPIFPCSASRFRKGIERAHTSLGVSFGITTHSMRHGGATHDYINGVPFEDVRVKGRWKSPASCERYLQASRALMLAVRIPDRAPKLAVKLVSEPSHFMRKWSARYGMEAAEGTSGPLEDLSANPKPPSLSSSHPSQPRRGK